MEETKSEQLLEKITIPTLNEVTQQVVELIAATDATARDYSAVIVDDPGLSTTVLKLVNSALYSLPNRIVTIQGACVMLGLRNLSSLCLSAALGKEMAEGQSRAISACWKHCLATGHVAGCIAALVCPDSQSDASTAGLLNGVGVIGMLDTEGLGFAEVVAEASAANRNWCDVERERFGFDHTEISEGIVRRWRMRPGICEAVAGSECIDAMVSPESWCVTVASVAVQANTNEFRVRSDPEQDLKRLQDQMPAEWEKIQDQLPRLLEEADLQIELMRA